MTSVRIAEPESTALGSQLKLESFKMQFPTRLRITQKSASPHGERVCSNNGRMAVVISNRIHVHDKT